MALICPMHENKSKRANNRGAMFSKQRLAVRPAGQDILSTLAYSGTRQLFKIGCVMHP